MKELTPKDLARDAVVRCLEPELGGPAVDEMELIDAYATAAVEEEREACAKVAEAHNKYFTADGLSVCLSCIEKISRAVAGAIRMRGNL